MASDSEPRKFFPEAPSRPPQKSHFWEQKKPLMTQLELKLTNSNSSGCRTTQSA